jgi:hypothetical protein
MLRTLADCIYVYGIVRTHGEQFIRTGDTQNVAYKGRRYIGYPVVSFDLVLDTLYSRVVDFTEQETYHLFNVPDYEVGTKPCIVEVSQDEINIR